MPGIGIGVFLLAVGAIMTFAVSAEAEGFSINTIGIILMIVGGLAALLSMLFWSSMFGSRTDHRHESHAH